MYAQAPPPAGAARDLLIEYLVTREKSWRARLVAHSWRTETTRYDGEVKVTTITETQCPDAYHQRTVNGSKITEFYSIAGKEYRQNNGKWLVGKAARGFFYCASAEEVRRMEADRRSPEETVMNWADDFAGRSEAEKGPVRIIRGEKCQEWKLHNFGDPAEGREDHTNTECYALSDSHLVMSDSMTGRAPRPLTTINYDWNKPITIKPPVQ